MSEERMPTDAEGAQGERDSDGKPSAGWRILGVLLALALAFAAAVMVAAMIEIADTPLEDECIEMAAKAAENPSEPGCDEYFDGSSTQKSLSLVFGWSSGVIAALGALFSLVFAFTGGRGQFVLRLTAGAIILGALSILIGSV